MSRLQISGLSSMTLCAPGGAARHRTALASTGPVVVEESAGTGVRLIMTSEFFARMR
jgi:hypothetical protein